MENIMQLSKKLFRTKTIAQAMQDAKDAGEAQGHVLKRVLTVWDLMGIGIGGTIGAGIFVLTGVVMGKMAGPSIILSFVVAGITSLFACLCYSEFAARVPLSGSAYVYAYICLGEIISFVIAWNMVLEYSVAAACISRGFAGYANDLFDNSLPTWFIGTGDATDVFSFSFLSPLLIVILTFIIARGAQESARFNLIMTCAKCVIVLFIIFAGLGSVSSANFSPFFPYGIQGMFHGAGTIFFSFIGFDAVCSAAEEAINPQRDLPRAIIGSLAICTVLYIGIAYVLTGMVSYAIVDIDSPLSTAFGMHGMKWAQVIINIGACCGLITTSLSTLIPQPRIFFAMSRDGLLYKSFSRISKKYHTPSTATFVTGLLSAVAAAFFSLSSLGDLISIGTLLSYLIVSASVLILRYQSPEEPRKSTKLTLIAMIFMALTSFSGLNELPVALTVIFGVCNAVTCFFIFRLKQHNIPVSFKCPWVPFVPLLSMQACLHLMISLGYETWIRLIIWTIIGLAIYFSYGLKNAVAGREGYGLEAGQNSANNMDASVTAAAGEAQEMSDVVGTKNGRGGREEEAEQGMREREDEDVSEYAGKRGGLAAADSLSS